MAKVVTPKYYPRAELPPGSLVHIGKQQNTPVNIRIIEYDKQSYKEIEGATLEDCKNWHQHKKEGHIQWICVDGMHQTEIIATLGGIWDLHSLVMEDLLNSSQRAKIDDYEEYLYIVVRMLNYNQQAQEVENEQISLIQGDNFVIFIQERPSSLFNSILQRLRDSKGRLRVLGSDYLVYRLIDTIVDHYFVTLETIGSKIDILQNELFTNHSSELLQQIQQLKQDLTLLRRAVWPLREVISNLQQRQRDAAASEVAVYLRDLYDHVVQVIDIIEGFKDTTSGMIDIYMSASSNRLQEVMKVMTMFSVIFAPLTFIAGVYGMNFSVMPELKWQWGYLYVWCLMLLITASMLYYFYKKRWIGR